MNFNGHSLIKSNISIPKIVINLCIYSLGHQLRILNTDFALGNCLFRYVKVTKNVDLDKYKSRRYSLRFGSHSEFSLPDGTLGKITLFLELI